VITRNNNDITEGRITHGLPTERRFGDATVLVPPPWGTSLTAPRRLPVFGHRNRCAGTSHLWGFVTDCRRSIGDPCGAVAWIPGASHFATGEPR